MAQPGDYRYKLTSTGYSSSRYGPCEVCGRHASEVFYQSEERAYERLGGIGWTFDGCRCLFGHRECLLAKRRASPAQVEDATKDRSLEALRDVLHDGVDVVI